MVIAAKQLKNKTSHVLMPSHLICSMSGERAVSSPQPAHQHRTWPIYRFRSLEAAHPSRMDSLQQYRLSNFCLVTESFTFMAGTHSFPALDSWYSLEGRHVAGGRSADCVGACCYQAGTHLWTPVTLSSTIPLIFLNTFGYFLYIQCVRSPPSSRIWQVRRERLKTQTNCSFMRQKLSSFLPCWAASLRCWHSDQCTTRNHPQTPLSRQTLPHLEQDTF